MPPAWLNGSTRNKFETRHPVEQHQLWFTYWSADQTAEPRHDLLSGRNPGRLSVVQGLAPVALPIIGSHEEATGKPTDA
jgi:hypothetical protein